MPEKDATQEQIDVAIEEEIEEILERSRFEPHYDIEDVIAETEQWFDELDSLKQLTGT